MKTYSRIWACFILLTSIPPFICLGQKVPANDKVFEIRSANWEDTLWGEDITRNLRVLEDKAGKLTIDQVSTPALQPFFKPLDSIPQPLSALSTYWGQLFLSNELPKPADVYLYTGDNERVVVYIPTSSGSYKIETLQSFLSPTQRKVLYHRFCYVKLSLESRRIYRIFIHIQDHRFLSPDFQVKLENEQKFNRQNERHHLWQGIFQGMLWMMIAYNLLIFLLSRDQPYLFYGLYILCNSLHFLDIYGFTREYFWPLKPQISAWSQVILIPILIFYGQFLRGLLDTKNLIPKTDRIARRYLNLQLVIFPVVIILGLTDDWSVAAKILTINLASYSVVGLILVIKLVRTGNKVAYFFIAGTAFLCLSLLVNLLSSFFNDKPVIIPLGYAQWGTLAEILLFSLGLGYRTRVNELEKHLAQERLRTDIRIRQLEAEKLRELDTLKSRFFANISHEFRTPLTLIAGLLQPSRAAVSPPEKPAGLLLRQQEVDTMRRNTQRLLQLINQLLDLSRLEAGKLQLDCQPGEINHFLKGIAGSFVSRAERQQVTYRYDFPAEEVWVTFDADKLQKITENLLSNAFKFTPEGGSVTLAAHYEQEEALVRVHLTITDTGVGIAPEALPRIFDRFFQADPSATRTYEGTGIGLALTKELVELHGGKISVTSQPGQGSQFTVELPLAAAPAAEMVPQEVAVNKTLPDPAPERVEPAPGTYQTKVLVVEDNYDLRYYIREQLSRQYQVLEAQDGKAGLALAQKEVPDVVISDVMMPQMDGYALCKALKTDHRTSHIPVILLTARAAAEDRLEGLETGADDYLTKPFDLSELMVRTRNLIYSRQQLRQRFSQQGFWQPSQVALPSADEKFLQNVMAVIEQHLSDSDFDIEALGREVALSSSQLYRKLYALTNYAPSDLLRTMRLRRAAELLKARVGSVSEVAYQVGYKDLSHFSKSFKEQFGVPPSKYPHQ